VSPVGLTKDAGWEIGVSRTVPHDIDHVWTTLVSPEGLGVWVGPGAALGSAKGDAYATDDGTTGELRSLHPGDRVRLTWRPAGRDAPTTLQVTVRPAARGTTVRFHQERLADADEREAMRVHWSAALDRLAGVLDG
jgi:uncharacterized protein YndB with AHSA1/START domain